MSTTFASIAGSIGSSIGSIMPYVGNIGYEVGKLGYEVGTLGISGGTGLCVGVTVSNCYNKAIGIPAGILTSGIVYGVTHPNTPLENVIAYSGTALGATAAVASVATGVFVLVLIIIGTKSGAGDRNPKVW